MSSHNYLVINTACETCKRTCGKGTKAYPTICNQFTMITGDNLNGNAGKKAIA